MSNTPYPEGERYYSYRVSRSPGYPFVVLVGRRPNFKRSYRVKRWDCSIDQWVDDRYAARHWMYKSFEEVFDCIMKKAEALGQSENMEKYLSTMPLYIDYILQRELLD